MFKAVEENIWENTIYETKKNSHDLNTVQQIHNFK